MLAPMGAEYANLLRIHVEFHHDDHCEKAVPDRNGDMFSSGEFNPMRLKAKAQHSDTLSSHIKLRYINLSSKFTIHLFSFKISQKLRWGMLFRSLSDCQSLILNVMSGVSQFVRNSLQRHPDLICVIFSPHRFSPHRYLSTYIWNKNSKNFEETP